MGASNIVMSDFRDLPGSPIRTQHHQHRLHPQPILPGQAAPVACHIARQFLVIIGLEFGVENDRGGRANAH
jgi:hypothetical protein